MHAVCAHQPRMSGPLLTVPCTELLAVSPSPHLLGAWAPQREKSNRQGERGNHSLGRVKGSVHRGYVGCLRVRVVKRKRKATAWSSSKHATCATHQKV